ncbi:Endoglucanase-4 [Penicillium hetheringtonii]|uniref:AA9 family lytic polysaccharide monooxygenase n=1 Tax=Penicillium hetheringtonii TaxID=911720 RepID=A0AAD6H428_9EURO|nr:Endoglucanase-4 [Penicillium hetheringtonii]
MLQIVAPVLLATLVASHGHVTNIVVNGVSYEGWDINSFPYSSDPPAVVAWGTPNTGNGFIEPSNYGSDDIICHLNATNPKGHATVAAGGKINLQWTTWPDSHHGPVIDYLADCGDSCESVDKTTLKFFKIDGVGLVDGSEVPGTWGDDQAEGGAQNYPQCFNLKITGSGSDKPAGVLGTSLYKSTDPGILVNIYNSLSTYIVPGPTLYSGAVSISQATSAITASGTATTGIDSSPTTTASTTRTTITTTMTTSQTTTTTSRATTLSTTTSAGGGSTSTQSLYGQCGGSGWPGATACASTATCTAYNDYYSQCVPTST